MDEPLHTEPTYEVRTFLRGQREIKELTCEDRAPEFRAIVSAQGIVNGQQIQVQKPVTLQAETVQEAFEELDATLELHAAMALREAVDQLQAQNRKLILPGSSLPNGRMRLQK